NARHKIAMKGQAMIWQEKLTKNATFDYWFLNLVFLICLGFRILVLVFPICVTSVKVSLES
ncbi:MAG: hypothetical protein KJ666_03175, partial [Bacteroidetes bacterium]|nr:hypothetical protein [Bacteroidota bacterium]